MATDYVLDSSALIAYLDGEEGSRRVRDLFMQGRVGTATLWLHHLHLGEVYYIYRRRAGEGIAEEVLADISSLALRRVDRISLALLRVAGKFKAAGSLSYADAFAVALAQLRRAELVSADRNELGPLEERGEVRMLWIR